MKALVTSRGSIQLIAESGADHFIIKEFFRKQEKIQITSDRLGIVVLDNDYTEQIVSITIGMTNCES